MYVAVFLTILSVQLIDGVSSDDLKPRNNNNNNNNYTLCPERFSCKNSTLDNDERYCRCDSLCKVYDDCCDDYVGSSGSPENKVNLSSDVISCKRLDFYRSGFHYIVDRCPKGFERGYVKRNCRLQNFSSDDTFARVPVIGRQSTILYRNLYCAMCNDEQDVVFWNGSVDFYRHSRNRPTEITLDNMNFSPPDSYGIRTCLNVIRTCHRNYRNAKVKKRCTKSFQSNSFVISRKEERLQKPHYYRNADCAKCNFINEPRQMCTYFIDRFQHVSNAPDYSMLINIGFGNQTSIKLVGNVDPSVKKPRSNVSCNEKQIYDPIKKKCLTLHCPPRKKQTSKSCLQVKPK